MSTTNQDELPPYGADEPEAVEVPTGPSVLPTGPDERSMLGGMPKWVLWVVLAGLLLTAAVVAGALSGNIPGLPERPAATNQTAVEDRAVAVEPGTETTGVVCVEKANVRTGPGTEHDVSATLTTGDQVLYEAVAGTDDWVRLVGTETWLLADLLCQD